MKHDNHLAFIELLTDFTTTTLLHKNLLDFAVIAQMRKHASNDQILIS
jgi:hypothetical protein